MDVCPHIIHSLRDPITCDDICDFTQYHSTFVDSEHFIYFRNSFEKLF